jgi:predicted nuclease of predicted toxin-antitoxin system
MKALLDNNLSPRLVPLLDAAGWDVVHVGALGMESAPDTDVLAAARDTARVLISADTDFGGLLARTHATSPSVVLVRRVAGRRVEDLAPLLVANLTPLADDLATGSMVVIGDENVRVRRLPVV